MAVTIRRDADNKWVTWVNWNPWLSASAEAQPDGPGLTIDITNVSWVIPAALTEEPETPTTDDGGYTYFSGSGGTNGVEYPITCRVTYTVTSPTSTLNKTDATQDHSFTVILEDQ